MDPVDDEYGAFSDNWEILLDIERTMRRGRVAEGLWRAMGLRSYLSQSKDAKNGRWIGQKLDELVDSGIEQMFVPVTSDCPLVHV